MDLSNFDINMKKDNDNFDINRIESGDKIREYLKKLQQDVNASVKPLTNEKEAELMEKHSHLAENYPTLFERAIKNTLDQNTLEFMLNMLNQVKNKQKSEFDASTAVGQLLYNQHAKETVDSLPVPENKKI